MGRQKIRNILILALIIFFMGCTIHTEKTFLGGGDIPDVACMKTVGGYYFSSSLTIASVFKKCQIEPNDNRFYFSNYIKKGKLESDKLSPENRTTCWGLWNARLSRAQLATHDKATSNKENLTEIDNSDLVLSALFEGFLSGEAFEEYSRAGNSEINQYGCITPYNAVTVARELSLSKLLVGNIDIQSLSKVELWAAWMVVLHADLHINVQEDFERVFTVLAEEGLFDAIKVAMLADRISNAKKEPLKYGVLYKCINGQISQNLGNVANINQRRTLIKMESYEDWKEKILVEGACN